MIACAVKPVRALNLILFTMQFIILSVTGVHGPIIRKNTTKSAWGKLSIKERFERSAGVYIRNPRVIAYIVEGVEEDQDFVVKKNSAALSLSVPLEDSLQELIELHGFKHVCLVSTLSSAIFLRESHLVVDRIVRNIFFEDPSMSLPSRMDYADLRDVMCELVTQLSNCLTGDRVYNKDVTVEELDNLQKRVKGFVGSVEKQSKVIFRDGEWIKECGQYNAVFRNGVWQHYTSQYKKFESCPCGSTSVRDLDCTLECRLYTMSRILEQDSLQPDAIDDASLARLREVTHPYGMNSKSLKFGEGDETIGIWECVDVVPQVFSYLNPLTPINEAAATVADCAEACREAIDVVQDDYLQLRESVLNMLKDFFPNLLVNGVSFVVEISQLFVDFAFAIMEQSWRQVISCAVRVCCMLKIPGAAVSALVSFLGKNQGFPQYGREGEIEVQSASHCLLSSIVALLGTLILQSFPSIFHIRQIIEDLRLYNLLVPAINHFSSLFEVLPKLLPECVTAWLTILCPAMGVMKIANDDFFEWLWEAKDLTERRNFDSILQSEQSQIRVVSLRQQGLKLLQYASITPEISGKLYGTLSKVSTELDKLQHNLDIMAMAGSYREVPFCVNITGVAGVGKSFITSAFAQLFRPPGWPATHLIYGRNCMDENWDGYYGQFAVVCDDFGQFVEGKDFEELINMVNNEQFRPRFASMDDPSIGIKGTLFSSKLIVLSSNSAYPPCDNDVRHPIAVQRRRHMVWECALRPGFERWDGTLDENRLTPSIAKQFGHLVWRRMAPVKSMTGDNYISNWYSSREMFMISLGEYRQHRIRQRMALEKKVSNDWIEDMRQEDVFYDFDDVAQNPAPVLVMAQGGLSDLVTGTKKVADVCGGFKDQVLAELSSARTAWLSSNVHINSIMNGMQFLTSALGVFVAIKGFTSWMRGKTPIDVSAQSWEEPRAKRMSGKRRLPVVSQMASHLVDYRPIDNAGRDLVDEAIVPSTVYLQLNTGIMDGVKTRINAMTAFALCGDVLIAPWHFFHDCNGDLIQDGQDMYLDTSSWVADGKPKMPRYHFLFYQRNISPLMTKDGRHRDVVLYKCCLSASGGVVRPFRNRLDLVVKDSDLSNFGIERAAIVTMKGGKCGTYFPNHLCATTDAHRYYLDPLVDSDGKPCEGKKEMLILKGWQYDAVTRTGDCGAPIVVLNKNMVRKICGIHVATVDGNVGVGEVITQEQLRKALDAFPVIVENLPASTTHVSLDVPVHVYPQGAFDIMGTLDSSERTRLADATSLRKTFLFELFGPHTKEPAVLHPQDIRMEVKESPLLKAIEKYGTPSRPFDWNVLNEIKQDMVEFFSDERLGPLMILSEKQVINGIHGLEFFDSLNMASSPGYPFRSQLGKGESKRALFGGEDGELFVVDPLLRARLDLRESKAFEGLRVPSAFVDCLKDEKVSLAKVKLGKTRTFACAPVDFVMVLRKFCLAFVARVYVSRKRGFSAIGTNCESLEWNDMVSYLLEMSDVGFAGDFAKFDGTLSSDCMAMVCDVMNEVYNDGANQKVRATLFCELIHTIHHAMDCMYVCSGGNPSGNPMTAVLNTLVNETYLRYAWFHLVPEEWRCMAAYHNNVRTKIYGDDNWIAVAPRAVPFFNLQTVSNFLALYGITYLPPSKEKDTTTLVAPLLSWDFLKRKAVIVPEVYSSMYLAQLEMSTIYEMLNWRHDTIPEEEAVEQTATAALYFAFGHGRARFTEIRSKILEGYRRARRPLPNTLPTWRYLLQRYRNGGFPDVAVCPSGAVVWLNDLKGDTVSTVAMLKNSPTGVCSKNLTFLDFCKPIVDEDGIAILPTACVKQGNVKWVIPQSEVLTVDSNKFGITLTEQTEPVVQEAARGDMTSVESIAQRSMQDMDWDLKSMVERFNYVTTAQWTVGTPGVIYHAQVPQNLLQTDTVITPFTRFMFWRGQVEIRIQLNGTRFHMGRLIAYYVPLSSDSFATSSHVLNRPAQTAVQHMFLDPSVSSIVTLKIPFVNYKSYLNIGNGDASLIDYLGQFYLQDFTSLVAVSGASTTLNATIFVSFPNSEFKVPSDIPISSSAQILLDVGRRRYDTASFIAEMERRKQTRCSKKKRIVEVTPQGNSISNRVTNIFQAAADVTMPIEATGDKFDVKSNVSGMDKVNVPLQPQYLALKPFGYTNHCTNLEFLNRLALQPSSLNLVEPEHFGTNQDEMEFSYIFSLPTYMDSATWTSSNNPNDVIYSGLLGPCCMQGNRGINGYTASVAAVTDKQQWQPTMLDYGTLPFSFWRGGLRIKFDIVCTAFHVGRLWFGVHYGDYVVGSPVNIGQAFSSYGAAIDLGPECHTFVYDIPFLSTTQYKRVIHGRQGGDDTDLFNFVLGTWSLRVLNPLTVTNGVSPSVTINIFTSGADDYEVAGLHMNNVSWVPVQAQGAQDLVEMPTMSQNTIGRAMGTQIQRPINATQFGERYNSVREICRRYCLVKNIKTFNLEPIAAADAKVFVNLAVRVQPATNMVRGTFGHFARMFRVWRGSLRFKALWGVSSYGADLVTPGQEFPIKWWPSVLLDTQVDNSDEVTSFDSGSVAWTAASEVNNYGDTLVGVQPKYMLGQSGVDNGMGWPMDASEDPNTVQPGWRAPPVDLGSPNVPYQEFEMPFCTIFNVLQTNLEQVALRQAANDDYLTTPGILWFALNANQNYITPTGAQAHFQMWMAAGDDFRLGLLLGPCTVQLQFLTTAGGTSVGAFTFDTY